MPALSAVSKDVSAFSVSKKLLPKSAVGVDQLLDTEKNNKLKVVYSNKTTHLYLHVLGVSASKRPCAVSLLVFVSSSCP